MAGIITNILVLMFFIYFTQSINALLESSSESRCIESEWKALVEFKASLRDNSSSLSSWIGRDCCSWNGITCHNLTGHVQALQLGGFISIIPGGAKSYDGTEIYFHSPLSPWLFNLTHLEVLTIYGCGFQGPIPNMFEKLTSLTHLDLSGNAFDSAFPDSLCNLTSLIYLDLSDLQLQNSLPLCLGNLTSLIQLYLVDNELSGEIPGWLGSLTRLTNLVLINGFNSSIPSTFGNLKDLEYLDLSYNELSGAIPSDLGNLTKLEQLYVNGNSLTGELCESILGGLKSLDSLDISENYNLIFNVSPQWIPPFQLSSIRMDSVFIGTQFPPWLRTQTNLKKLSMKNVSIYGAIPDWFLTALPHLKEIDLSNNLLTRFFSDHGCLTAFPNVTGIDLSNNLLIGSIPDQCLTAFPNLMSIDLSSNSLTGSIPTFDSPSLRVLLLSRNQFGNIPQQLCNLTSLGSLSLRSNQLIGIIPSCLRALRGLVVLDMGNNFLSGEIPELGSMTNLSILHLNENNFFGKLPPLQNLTLLTTLDLGDNEFQGSIPKWIGKNWSSFQYLRLESNNFSGEISSNFCQLPSLRIMNLALNHLVGIIPPCIGNLSKISKDSDDTSYSYYSDEPLLNIIKGREMEFTSSLRYAKFISLSGNHLHGEIPTGLMNLKGLHSLNLSNNELTGMIPQSINNLSNLESLDLSMNRFSGIIPQSLADIDGLGYLNLSFNNLAGRIPSGDHFDTLDDPSIYQGNKELCGKLLMKSCLGDDLAISNQPNGPVSRGDAHDEFDRLSWMYAGIGPGFAVGFLGVICTLYFKDGWRIAFFGFTDDMYNKVIVAVTI